MDRNPLSDLEGREYNHERLHSSLCYLTPVAFKQLWERQHQERLSLALAHQ
jgi:transposase InsO family protein